MAGVRTFYEELKRRRVIRVATLYVVAIWPIIQLLDIISPTLNIPESVLRYLVIAFFSGLPVALILAWVFDLDRDGIHLDDGEAGEALLGSRTDIMIVGVLCVLVVGLFFVQLSLEEDTPAKPSVANEAAPAVESNSIAVKPFDSFSADPKDQYFADGLSEELLNVLASVPELRVAARTSSFAYKGVNRNISEIGQELNVANILEGSVRANDIDNTIRVTAQLIDVATGQHIWSETYTHQYSDVFKIQDEISAAVADKLKVTLIDENQPTTANVIRTSNTDALIAYGRGQQELAKRTEAGIAEAVELFQSAVDADPNFALAYAGLSDAHTLGVSYDLVDRDAGLQSAKQAYEKALELDADLGVAWASRGLWLSQFKERKQEARQVLEKAMQLNPSYSMAVMWRATLEEDESAKIALYERAVALDPKAPVAAFNLASMYSVQGRDAEVMALFSQMVEADPSFPRGYELVANINERSGRLGEAIRYYQTAYELGGDINHSLKLSTLYGDIGDYEKADIWYDEVKKTVPEEYAVRVRWFRLGRYISANDFNEVTSLLKSIRDAEVDGLEGDFDRILANFYLGDVDQIVSDYDRAMRSEKEFIHLDDYGRDMHLQMKLVVANQLMQSGKKKRAAELLDDVEVGLREKLDNPSKDWPADWYDLARVAAIRGEQQQAMIYTQRAVDEGWREHWRPGFDPIMSGVVKTQRFQTMMGALDNRLSIIRDQFELDAMFES